MRKLFLWILLLCLGLCACGRGAVGAGETAETAKLPVLKPESPEPFPALPGEEEDIPRLSSPEGETPTVSGPAGTVVARTFLGAWCQDPVYGDVDGDGQTELLYLCPGPTSGLFTEAVCVYGLEQGWPVLKACTILNLSWGEPHLEREGNEILFCLEPTDWHPGPSGDPKEALRLPVTVWENEVLLNGGELPDGVQNWGGIVWNRFGMSFAALSKQVGEQAVLKHWSCLIWQEPTLVSSVQTGAAVGPELCAAVSGNNVTVTGYLRWGYRSDGELYCMRNGIEPIPPVEDPQALVGLTAAELEAKLGPCHFDLGSGLYIPCWFTEDGKLLTVQLLDSVTGAGLRDLLAGEPLFEEKLDPDTVSVDLREIPTLVKNMDRWQTFLENTKRGEADAVTLRIIYDKSGYSLPLSYDGSVYTLEDEGKAYSYKYLIISEDNDPAAHAKFGTVVQYLLSDDQTMTGKRYFAHMVSSAYDPDFPNTRTVFTVYDP